MHVYECRPSYEDDRPQIDFEAVENAKNDWLAIGEVLDGSRPVTEFPDDVVISIAHTDAMVWDSYTVAGTRGLFSRRFVDTVGADALQWFSLFPAKLNETPYFFLRCDQVLDCLDRAQAAFETYRCDPTVIKRISHYAFHEKHLPKDGCFCIAELPDLLLTENVVNRLNAGKLKGLCLMQLP